MDAEQIAREFGELIKRASDDAERARLAFVSGNHQAYIESVFQEVKQRIDSAYNDLDGPRDDSGTA